MSKAELENQIRDGILTKIADFLQKEYDTDVKPVSTSELMMPVLDAEGNEKFAVIRVMIPRGTRSNGTYIPYDGYVAAEEYEATIAQKESEKLAQENARKAKEEEKERKMAERRTATKNKLALLEMRKARLEELKKAEGM